MISGVFFLGGGVTDIVNSYSGHQLRGERIITSNLHNIQLGKEISLLYLDYGLRYI